ncbi:MAG: glycosyltransferase family 2 protein [Chloroflexota bacterium]|nr:MAG: glycosyltransferase family 2 protein [Chloroflexota bacterium]
MITLSVIIPAYNEENGIEEVVQRVLAIRPALNQMNAALEFIIVDDGSRDGTVALLSKCPDVRLIKHLKNRGYGAAIKTGFRHATGEYLAFLDADGTYPPEKLPEMLRVAINEKADLVVGSRMSGAKSEMPLTRRVGNFAYAMLLSLIGNVAVRDTASGMRILRKDTLERLYPLPDGLEFTPAMSTRAIHENLRVVEVPIPYAERVGRSKLSVVRDGFRFTNAIVWTALGYNPVRILGLTSLALFGIALAIGLYILALRLGGVTTLEAWQVYALFAATILTVVAMSLFLLGTMFNYLVALFHKHPMRQGLFGKPIFNPSLDHYFGWMGLASAGVGIFLSVVTLGLSLSGWEITRLWFYQLASAMFVIVGVQLGIAWIVMRVLEELAKREGEARRDLVETDAVDMNRSVEAIPGVETR